MRIRLHIDGQQGGCKLDRGVTQGSIVGLCSPAAALQGGQRQWTSNLTCRGLSTPASLMLVAVLGHSSVRMVAASSSRCVADSHVSRLCDRNLRAQPYHTTCSSMTHGPCDAAINITILHHMWFGRAH